MITVCVCVAGEQAPVGVTVFRTVYVPGVEADKSISPVLVFTKTKPAGTEENTPAVPVTVAIGSRPDVQ